MNARAVIQAGRLRPDSKKSRLVLMNRLRVAPIPRTKTKFSAMIA
jgi:hypothetical protein